MKASVLGTQTPARYTSRYITNFYFCFLRSFKTSKALNLSTAYHFSCICSILIIACFSTTQTTQAKGAAQINVFSSSWIHGKCQPFYGLFYFIFLLLFFQFYFKYALDELNSDQRFCYRQSRTHSVGLPTRTSLLPEPPPAGNDGAPPIPRRHSATPAVGVELHHVHRITCSIRFFDCLFFKHIFLFKSIVQTCSQVGNFEQDNCKRINKKSL